MEKTEAKRRVGRPQTIPTGARERKVWLTDAEVAAITRAAGPLSLAEFLRRAALAAAGIQAEK